MLDEFMFESGEPAKEMQALRLAVARGQAKSTISECNVDYTWIELQRGLLEKLDPFIAKLLDDVPGARLCGGCFKDILDGKTPHDYDLFFKSNDAFSVAVGKLEKGGLAPMFKTANAFAYIVDGKRIELIRRVFFYGRSMEWLLEKFDYPVAKIGIEKSNAQGGEPSYSLVFHRNAMKHIVEKRLVNGKEELDIHDIERLLKYTRYGYKIARRDLLSMMERYATHMLHEGFVREPSAEDAESECYQGI